MIMCITISTKMTKATKLNDSENIAGNNAAKESSTQVTLMCLINIIIIIVVDVKVQTLQIPNCAPSTRSCVCLYSFFAIHSVY